MLLNVICSGLLVLTSKMLKLDGKTLIVLGCNEAAGQELIRNRVPNSLSNMHYHDWVQAINEQWSFKKRNGKTAVPIKLIGTGLVKFDDGITRYQNGKVWSVDDCDTDIVSLNIV